MRKLIELGFEASEKQPAWRTLAACISLWAAVCGVHCVAARAETVRSAAYCMGAIDQKIEMLKSLGPPPPKLDGSYDFEGNAVILDALAQLNVTRERFRRHVTTHIDQSGDDAATVMDEKSRGEIDAATCAGDQ